jgi:chromate transporter
MTESNTSVYPERLKPSFRDAFWFWLKLGFISFGGPAGQIAIMHEFLVDRKKWISDSRFMHALNYCMILPGPEAQQLATYIGWLLHGTLGGLTAGILFILPSVFILLGLSMAYVVFGKLAWVAAVFYGLKPAVVAIIILALFKIGRKSLQSLFHYVVAAASFISIFFFNIPFPYIVGSAIVIGFFGQRIFPMFFKPSINREPSTADEHLYYLNRYSQSTDAPFTWKNIVFPLALGLVLWFIPFLFVHAGTQQEFWITLISFFTKAAFVTFGGAYAVLPYVAQVSVENYNWLSELEMIDGLALGETTPGPLIMVLVFVGFMAGYNQMGGSLMAASTGLFLTTFYTFLPCFLFIFIGAPLVERTKENDNLKRILSIVTAAVVGVILNLAIYFGKAILIKPGNVQPDWFSILWLGFSLFALYRLKINIILWIFISAVVGLLFLLTAGAV